MNKPLDELYFKWLYGQVCSSRTRNPSRSYRTLLEQLFRKEFVWLVANDDNRAEDGRDLRYEFLESRRLYNVDPNWFNLGCSMLEMMVGISRRLSFEGGGEPRDWFWHLVQNLSLDDYNDDTPIHEKEVDDVLDRVIWRVYKRNGHGGLFPLRGATKDQRSVELWYQLSAYLLELQDIERREVEWISSRSA